MDARSPPLMRVVICPWLAFGHLLPYLELAERLTSRGHRVYYVSTPRNIARLPPLSPVAAPRVELVALPLPRVEGLPDGAESTKDVPRDKRDLHWKAFVELLAAACADGGGGGRQERRQTCCEEGEFGDAGRLASLGQSER